MNPVSGQLSGQSHTQGSDAGTKPQRFTRTIRLRARETLTTEGILKGQRFTLRQRRRRAATVWAVLWALALVSVLIPLVHFALVPALLIAGPVAAYFRYRVEAVVETAVGECPLCHQSITLPLDASTELPHWDNCPECDGHLQLLESEEAPDEEKEH